MVMGRRIVGATLAVAGLVLGFSGCAGRSTGQDGSGGKTATGGSGVTGGAGGRGGAGGTGGGSTGGSATGGSATGGGSGGTSTGGSSTGGSSTGGSSTGGSSTGGSAGTASITGGTGGTAGTSAGSAGTAAGSSGGEGGQPACEDATIRAFCVVGIPISSGDRISVGQPLQLQLFPNGCYSSSCTTVVSAFCSYLASENEIWVSPFVCLRQEGDSCTEDCGGGNTGCDVGLNLTEGVTTVSIAGTDLSVTLTVPSVATGGELCVGNAVL